MRKVLVAFALILSTSAVAEEKGIDRPGSDYKNFAVNRFQDCDHACFVEGTKCKAWTYVAAGVQGSVGRC
jgi:hypothetical protein